MVSPSLSATIQSRRYFRSAWRRAYARFLADPRAIAGLVEAEFQRAGLDMATANQDLGAALQRVGMPPFDPIRDSIHWTVFAALLTRPVRRILEIGTYDGQFTRLLSALYPQAEIVTVDLPEDDPILRSTYGRRGDEAYGQFVEKQRRNLSGERIRALKLNSFFLAGHVQGPFDLVWVDGGHLYPEVAWDLSTAWNLASPGGAVLCDDVIPINKLYKDAYVSTESHEVIQYMAARTSVTPFYFLKRQDPRQYALPSTRKFVALINKPITAAKAF